MTSWLTLDGCTRVRFDQIHPPVGATEELKAILLPLQHRYRSWDVLERDDFPVTQARKAHFPRIAPIAAPKHHLVR